MPILIKDMEMPESCDVCPLCYDWIECMAANPVLRFDYRGNAGEFDFCHERHERCPLVEIKRPNYDAALLLDCGMEE